MRILIVPLPVLAPTLGSQERVKYLIEGFKRESIEVATCAAADVNFKKQADVPNYFLEVPIPMGLPNQLGRNLFQIAARTGITQRKAVHSFEEVLFLSGALSRHYFAKNIECVRKAIHQYHPDIVYSEFNLGTIVAAKLEHIRVLTNYSYPVQASYASDPRFAKGVNKVLQEIGLPQINSSLELFDLADYKIIPSSCRLEPIEGKNVIFTGPFFQSKSTVHSEEKKNKLVAYMGTGTISPKRLLKELYKAFYRSNYEVYIVGKGLADEVDENIHTAEHFNFKELLPQAAAMIHHGGQNSVMDALSFGVPQLICPGKVFERRYNAQSVAKEGAGIVIEEADFHSIQIREAITRLSKEPSYNEKSKQIWQEITELGGVNRVIQLINQMK